VAARAPTLKELYWSGGRDFVDSSVLLFGMTLPIAIYTRLSNDEFGTQTATQRQAEACSAYAALRGWEVGKVFEDVDLSAFRAVTRPAYEEMLAGISAGRWGGVLVWKLDRLVRRPAEFERFWATCERAGAVLMSVNDPIDTTTDVGLAIVRILVTFANLESATTSLRMRAQRREHAAKGLPPFSGRAFGYTRPHQRGRRRGRPDRRGGRAGPVRGRAAHHYRRL